MSFKKIIGWIISATLPVVLINLGIAVINKEKYVGIITILMGFSLIYFAYYAFQIKENENKIEEIKEWIENKEELLNTLKDIVILKKVSKIK